MCVRLWAFPLPLAALPVSGGRSITVCERGSAAGSRPPLTSAVPPPLRSIRRGAAALPQPVCHGGAAADRQPAHRVRCQVRILAHCPPVALQPAVFAAILCDSTSTARRGCPHSDTPEAALPSTPAGMRWRCAAACGASSGRTASPCLDWMRTRCAVRWAGASCAGQGCSLPCLWSVAAQPASAPRGRWVELRPLAIAAGAAAAGGGTTDCRAVVAARQSSAARPLLQWAQGCRASLYIGLADRAVEKHVVCLLACRLTATTAS